MSLDLYLFDKDDVPDDERAIGWLLRADYFRGGPIGRVDLAATGPTSPIPPGIPALPRPGESYASPELSELLASTPAAQLADRFPGTQVGIIGSEALPAPDTLIIIIGRDVADLSEQGGAQQVTQISATPPKRMFEWMCACRHRCQRHDAGPVGGDRRAAVPGTDLHRRRDPVVGRPARALRGFETGASSSVVSVALTDRVHWDERYASSGPAPADEIGPPPLFAPHEDLFPTSGCALELACGRGRGAAWLASRGLRVWALDVSPVAIGLAQDLVRRAGLAHRCHFDIVDLDEGIPPGSPVDLVLCHLFRDPRLDHAVTERLLPGGLLAIAALSELDVGPGRFRAARGELPEAFQHLDVIESGEQNGEAWLLGRRRL